MRPSCQAVILRTLGGLYSVLPLGDLSSQCCDLSKLLYVAVQYCRKPESLSILLLSLLLLGENVFFLCNPGCPETFYVVHSALELLAFLP